MTSGGSGSDTESLAPDKVPVKLEIVEEDPLEEEEGPLSKRPKASSDPEQQWGAGANAFPIPPSQYNPLDEPSPLGLRLKKSPSLLDLIQMRLSQGNPTSQVGECESYGSGVKQETQNTTMASGSTDKMKASNFPASVLKIGQWEYKSRYEGDLVAKCYFAKRKLVWEILEGGLKSKIEIQWSDIMALKAVCPDNGPGELNVVLSKQPLFFRETNPQPRKHTLWQATADFTDDQASIHRQHFLECPPDLLSKNFEKLIQCDGRLKILSMQPDIILDSPYFEARSSVFESLEDPKCPEKVETDKQSTLSSVQIQSSLSEDSSSSKSEWLDCSGAASELRSKELSPNTAIDARSTEATGGCEVVDSKDTSGEKQIKVPGLKKSISVSELMSHLGQCITGKVESTKDLSSVSESACQDILDIADYLLSDTQFAPASSDEKSLMMRVNSLCCLLQKEPSVATPSVQASDESCIEEPDSGKIVQLSDCTESVNSETVMEIKDLKGDPKDASGCKQAGMSRKDSFSDLLLHLPRIASLPKFLFDISEDK